MNIEKLTLYHGTCEDDTQKLLAEGWKPSQQASGANQGNPKYLYLSTEPADALWFAEEKGCNVVLVVKNIPLNYLEVDPEDGVGSTVVEELAISQRTGLPAKLVLTQPLPAKYFERYFKPNPKRRFTTEELKFLIPSVTITAHDYGKNSVYLEWISVPAQHRKQGLGSAAYLAWETNLPVKYKYVYLHAADSGSGQTDSFWEALGFQHVYNFYEEIYPHEPAYEDYHYMVKGIRGTPTPDPLEITQD